MNESIPKIVFAIVFVIVSLICANKLPKGHISYNSISAESPQKWSEVSCLDLAPTEIYEKRREIEMKWKEAHPNAENVRFIYTVSEGQVCLLVHYDK